jgi:prevent-host-death family protein
MMTEIVGLRELKNNLSRYVRKVRAGEVVAIADRGQVIAELTPPRPKSDPKAALDDMARRGQLTLAQPLTKKERTSLYRLRDPALAGLTAQHLLDESRGER